jgi:hypothetical protein
VRAISWILCTLSRLLGKMTAGKMQKVSDGHEAFVATFATGTIVFR